MKCHRGIIRVLAAVLFLFCSHSYAQTCTAFPYPLTAGTTASGSQVIADLTYVATCKNQVPSFSAYLSTNQSITAGVNTKVALNTVSYDVGNYFDSPNHRYTPKLAGKYLIVGQIYATGTTAEFTAMIYKNGSAAAQTYSSLYGTILSTSAIITLNGSTDYVELWGEATGTSAQQFFGAANLTFLQGYWLGP